MESDCSSVGLTTDDDEYWEAELARDFRRVVRGLSMCHKFERQADLFEQRSLLAPVVPHYKLH